MQVREKHEIMRDIEMTREALPQAWEIVSERNPIRVAAQAGKAAIIRWKGRSAAKSRAADQKLRTTPYLYIGAALLVGAVVGVVVTSMRRRREVTRVSIKRL